MKNLHLIALAVILALASCTEKKDGKRKESKVASIGQPSEVLLVTDTKVLNSSAKDSLEEMLTINVPGLNQGEDYFRMSRIPESMDQKDFQKIHSRLLVKVNSKLKEVTLGSAKNVHANPQLEVMLTGPSADAITKYLSSHADHIRDLLLQSQLDMQTTYLKGHFSKEVRKDLKQMFGYAIDAPEEIKFTKKGENCLWASSRTQDKQLNMVFYAVPLDNKMPMECLGNDSRLTLQEEDMMVRFLATLRDSVMMENIPGSKPDQWMETTWEDETPIAMVRKTALNGNRAIEMRGLWQMRNGAMGGPFVSVAQIDRKKNLLFVAEGFVYSPGTTKRDLVRKLEASFRTLTGIGQ